MKSIDTSHNAWLLQTFCVYFYRYYQHFSKFRFSWGISFKLFSSGISTSSEFPSRSGIVWKGFAKPWNVDALIPFGSDCEEIKFQTCWVCKLNTSVWDWSSGCVTCGYSRLPSGGCDFIRNRPTVDGYGMCELFDFAAMILEQLKTNLPWYDQFVGGRGMKKKCGMNNTRRDHGMGVYEIDVQSPSKSRSLRRLQTMSNSRVLCSNRGFSVEKSKNDGVPHWQAETRDQAGDAPCQ